MKKILITGASGFVGSFLVEEALKRDMEVYAGVRATSSRRYLQQSELQFFEVNFNDEKGMAEKLAAKQFDIIIHNAGIVGAPKAADYFRVNSKMTQKFVCAIQKSTPNLQKFVYTSSLAAFGPASENELTGIVTEDTPPKPITTYGKSKLEAEQFLFQQKGFPWIIVRPTAVYGPRETDIFSFFKMVNFHLETYIGFQKQLLTFIYVKDLARIMIDASLSEETEKAYFISDGQTYDTTDLGKYASRFLNKKTAIIRVPIGIVKVVAAVAEAFGNLTGKMPTFNKEKVAELKARNWQCDISPAQDDLHFIPQYDLKKGMEETIAWYKKEGWL